MALFIEKNSKFGEASVTIIGITREIYGRPQYVLVSADVPEGGLKFPGLTFRAPLSGKETLEDSARAMFEEQTGLGIEKMLGLRAIVPTRSRHNNQWIFRNVFLGVVGDADKRNTPSKNRGVYIAEPGQGIAPKEDYVISLANSRERVPLQWVKSDNQIIARIATDILYNFNWEKLSTDWYRKIPCVGAPPQTQSTERPLCCGLAVASMMLIYRPNENEDLHVILLKRKGDEYPGYAGGKIETPDFEDSQNIDPISCCAKEGSEEFGFLIQPRALICCAVTPLDMPGNDSGKYYNSIINYSFVAEPTNPREVEKALRNPEKCLEGKMEAYAVESLDAHRDRIFRRHLRMPDMPFIGEQFFRTSPGDKISLTQIVSSGLK